MSDVETLEKKFKESTVTYSRNEIGFFNDCLKGGVGFSKNLISHFKEKAKHFNDRKERACYYNVLKDILLIYSGFVSKQRVNRSGIKESLFTKFLDKTDLEGRKLGSFISDIVLPELLVTGRVFIVIDSPSIPENISKKDEEDLDINPYAYIIPTQDVLGFGLNSDLSVKWIKYKSDVVDDTDPFDIKQYTKYTVLTRDVIYYMLEAKGETEKVGKFGEEENKLGYVPVVYKKFTIQESPLFTDICYLSKKLYNIDSLLDEILYRQTFSQLIYPSDSNMKLSKRKLGTSYVFTFPPESSHKPGFISPDVEQGRFLLSVVIDLIDKIKVKAHVKIVGKNNNVSSKTREYDFHLLNQILVKIISCLELIERSMFEMVSKYDDSVSISDDFSISYSSGFSVLSLVDDLTNYVDTLKLNLSDSINKMSKETITQIMFGDRSPAILDDLLSSVDGSPYSGEEDAFSEISREKSSKVRKKDGYSKEKKSTLDEKEKL